MSDVSELERAMAQVRVFTLAYMGSLADRMSAFARQVNATQAELAETEKPDVEH